MTDGIEYACVALVCYGIGDFIYKRAAMAGIRADHFLMGQAWFFFPLIVVYAAATHTLVIRPAALWGMLAGVFVFIGFYNFVRSLVTGSVGINASIFRLNFIVTALLAIVFLGEPLTGSKSAGLCLAALAAWLLLGTQPSGERRHEDRRSLAQVAVATVAFGAANFFHTVGLRQGVVPETMVAAQAALFMPLATAFVIRVDRRLRPPPATWRYGAVVSLVLLVAFVSLLRGVALGQASVMVPIAQMGFIVTALLGVVVLHEPVTVRKVLGLVCALAALAALAMS
jgi:drug/metabolite transporter (DMT)-like permease